jgi:hypothetical protein
MVTRNSPKALEILAARKLYVIPLAPRVQWESASYRRGDSDLVLSFSPTIFCGMFSLSTNEEDEEPIFASPPPLPLFAVVLADGLVMKILSGS